MSWLCWAGGWCLARAVLPRQLQQTDELSSDNGAGQDDSQTWLKAAWLSSDAVGELSKLEHFNRLIFSPFYCFR